MSQIETIKHQFHALIDQADDEVILSHFYEVFASSVQSQGNSAWGSLSKQQQLSLAQSYEESKQSDKRIPNAEVWKKYGQGLPNRIDAHC